MRILILMYLLHSTQTLTIPVNVWLIIAGLTYFKWSIGFLRMFTQGFTHAEE